MHNIYFSAATAALEWYFFISWRRWATYICFLQHKANYPRYWICYILNTYVYSWNTDWAAIGSIIITIYWWTEWRRMVFWKLIVLCNYAFSFLSKVRNVTLKEMNVRFIFTSAQNIVMLRSAFIRWGIKVL